MPRISALSKACRRAGTRPASKGDRSRPIRRPRCTSSSSRSPGCSTPPPRAPDMGGTSVRRLFVLLCGFEFLPKSISTRNMGENFIMSEPISAYLLDTESGWILLDTGFDPANVQDLWTMDRHFFSKGIHPPIVAPEHRLDRQFAEIGIGFEDVKHVIITHLHFDHTGYLKYFPHAKVSIQRREYAFGFGGR